MWKCQQLHHVQIISCSLFMWIIVFLLFWVGKVTFSMSDLIYPLLGLSKYCFQAKLLFSNVCLSCIQRFWPNQVLAGHFFKLNIKASFLNRKEKQQRWSSLTTGSCFMRTRCLFFHARPQKQSSLLQKISSVEPLRVFVRACTKETHQVAKCPFCLPSLCENKCLSSGHC